MARFNVKLQKESLGKLLICVLQLHNAPTKRNKNVWKQTLMFCIRYIQYTHNNIHSMTEINLQLSTVNKIVTIAKLLNMCTKKVTIVKLPTSYKQNKSNL